MSTNQTHSFTITCRDASNRKRVLKELQERKFTLIESLVSKILIIGECQNWSLHSILEFLDSEKRAGNVIEYVHLLKQE